MGNPFETKADALANSKREIARLPIYKFIKDNFDLWDELYFIEEKIFDLTCEIEKNSLMLGEIDKGDFLQKIDTLKKEELAVLDKLIRKLDKSTGIKSLPSSEKLYAAFNLICEADENSEYEENLTDTTADEQENYIPDISQLLRKRSVEKKTRMQRPTSLKSKKEIEAILENDNERLENIRKILSTSSTKNSDPDAFDPQGNLLEISKRTVSDPQKEKPQLTPRKKKEHLEKYKNELGIQMLGMSKINSFLEDKLSQIDSIDQESLYHEFNLRAKEYKLADWQIKRYEGVFDAFTEATRENIEYLDKHKNLSNREIIENILDYTCKGEVEMEKHPFAIIFILSDDTDFSRIQIPESSHKETDAENLEKTKNHGGFYQRGFIFIKKTETTDPQVKQKIIAHEIKHRINELIQKGAYNKEFSQYSDPKNIQEYFADELALALSMAKNEILAYLKDGEDTEGILERLIHSDDYDFLDEANYKKQKTEEGVCGDHIDDILKKYDAKTIQSELIKCRNKYIKLVSDCLDVLDVLERWGFSRGEIIGMFQVQKMANWKKALDRLENNSRFIEERSIASDNKIKLLAEDLQRYRKENSWLKRKLDKLKVNLPFGLSDYISFESFRESTLESQLHLLQKEKSRWNRGVYEKIKE